MLWMNLRLGYLEKPLHFHNATTKSQLQTHLVYYGTYKAVVGFSVRSLSYWCFQPIFSAISIISNASSRRVRYGVLRFAIEDGVFDENLQYASEDKTLVNKMVKSGVIGYNDACVRAQISEPILLKEWIFHLCKMSKYVDSWLYICWIDHEANYHLWGFLIATAPSYFQVTEYPRKRINA